MASDTSTTAAEGSSSASLRSSSEATRPDPGPLPTKRGEIGYVEPVEGAEGSTSSSPEPTLPARHPADRDASQPSPAATTTSLSRTNTTSQPSTPSTTSSALVNPDKTKKSRLEQKCFGGLILGSLLAFIAQFIFFGGTIAGWVLVVMTLNKPAPSSSSDSADSSGSESSFGNSVIFVHVLFVVASLGQLLFLERRIWRLRAERYNHLHPGEVLPVSHRRRWLGNPTAIAFSPWNRPPLPTYAAALRESGSGTGDVEDHMIAVPPPPAYGNTRGSRLLLTGFLRDSLRAQRPPSVHSEMSQRDLEGGGSRPTSYRSKDEEWEEIQDADRARRLEETLARLERPTSRN